MEAQRMKITIFDTWRRVVLWVDVQDVSGGIVNTLGGGSMDYSE